MSATDRGAPILCVMAKAPVSGLAKTRLKDRYSLDECAVIAQVLLQVTVERLVTYWPGELQLWCAPNSSHPVFQRLRDTFNVRLFAQVEGDLGDKMKGAINAGLRQGANCAVIGSDCPSVDQTTMRRAYDLLVANENIYGASDDGGFWLLGMTQEIDNLFHDVPWSHETTGMNLLKRADAQHITLNTSIGTLTDIDTPEDLARLRAVDRRIDQCLSEAQIESRIHLPIDSGPGA